MNSLILKVFYFLLYFKAFATVRAISKCLIVVLHLAQRIIMPSVAWPRVPQHRQRKEVAFLERNLIDRRTNDFQNAGQLPFPITIRLIHLVMTLIKCIVRNTRRVRSFHTITAF